MPPASEGWARWRLAAIGLATAGVVAGAFWFFGPDDDDAGPGTSAIPPDALSSTTVDGVEPPTTPAASTLPPTSTPSMPVPDTTSPPATTVAPTTIPTPPTTSSVPASAPIGAEWVDDGRLPAPGFETLGGTFLIEVGYVVELLYGPDGYQIWLAAVLDDSGTYLELRLVDAVAVQITESTAVVLGRTPCVVDGMVNDLVVGTFLYEDQPELVLPLEVWLVDPIGGRMEPIIGTASCLNEGYGV